MIRANRNLREVHPWLGADWHLFQQAAAGDARICTTSILIMRDGD